MRALLFAALLSCGDGAIVWDVRALDEAHREAFAGRCAEWNAVADRQQYVTTGAGTHVVEVRPRGEMANGPRANSEYAHGVMHVAPDLGDHFAFSVAHEQGHALGLDHHAGPGVMATTATTETLTAEDIDECMRVGACD